MSDLKVQFECLAEITGLPFKRRGNKMISATYIDGRPHINRDKTFAVLKDGIGIYIKEGGGEDISLNEWLRLYGDIDKLECEYHADVVEYKIPERVYVDELFLDCSIPMEYKGNLFKFLVGKFGYEKTLNAFRKYRVGEVDGDTVFWYVNELGQICHDNIMTYGENGKRMKEIPPRRKFFMNNGYTGECLFGAHLFEFNKEICVVESEKTAIIMSIFDKKQRIWMATGGSEKMLHIKEEMKLFPDYDKAGFKWKGNVVEWWNGLDVENGWDVADYVLNKII